MEYKILGKSGLKVSAVGLGGGAQSGLPKNFVEIMRKAFDLGITLIDTAESYYEGRSEELYGEAIKGRRDEVVIVTKVFGEHLRYNDVLKAAEGSLKRLGVNIIDLYLVHWPNPKIPLSETMKAMESLVNEGVVRHIGVSNFNVDLIKEAQAALAQHEIVVNEVKYNLLERDIEAETLPYCMKENIGIIAYSPLASGLLAERFVDETKIPEEDGRKKVELFQGEKFTKGLALVKVLKEIGASHGKTPSQVSLNWLATKPNVVPIFAASNISQVEENCGALGWRLKDEELKTIENAYKKIMKE